MQLPLKVIDRPMVWLFILSLLLSFLFAGCNTQEKDFLSVLVFSKTAGFRHASIKDGKQMFYRMAEEHNFKVDTSEDASIFNRKDLQKYNVIVFLSTTGDILNDEQETALRQFMQA
ncbi:MAG: ThuA domain-containing protein, partial [Bacteroidota bacterium]